MHFIIPKKMKLFTGFMVLALLSVLYFYFFNKVEFALGSLSSTGVEGIDLVVRIDEQEVFADTLLYDMDNYHISKITLRPGYHKVSISSIKAKINKEERVFIFFNNSIIIEYYLQDSLNMQNEDFSISVINGRFYYE